MNTLNNSILDKFDEDTKALKRLLAMKEEYEAENSVTAVEAKMKNQEISLTWSQIVDYDLSTSAFPQVDSYTHLIKRTVKNITRIDNKLVGFVKMGGKTLKVTKDVNYPEDNWDIQGVL